MATVPYSYPPRAFTGPDDEVCRSVRVLLRYFKGSVLLALAGLAGGWVLGFSTPGTAAGAFSTLFIVAVLGLLEISLSFDNAVVNATVLRQMTSLWRRRFLTRGITIHEVPETVTGLIGAVFIGISFWSSLRYRRAHAAPAP